MCLGLILDAVKLGPSFMCLAASMDMKHLAQLNSIILEEVEAVINAGWVLLLSEGDNLMSGV